MTDKLVRVQDAWGRGPWRPGFSRKWTADDSPMMGQSIFEVKGALQAVNAAHAANLDIGCAVRESKLDYWFSPGDLARLKSLGFSIVDVSKCKILLETDEQALIASALPLAFFPKYEAAQ